MKFNIGQWVLKPGVQTYNCGQIRNGNTITVKLNGKSSSVKIEQIGTDCEISII